MIFTKESDYLPYQKTFDMYRKTAYCFVILFSFISIVQAQKGNITLSPQIFVRKASLAIPQFGVAASIHYNLGNYVAIGGIFIADAYFTTPKAINYYKIRSFSCTFIPEIQINFSNKKIIPFLKLQAFDGHYYYIVANNNNPTLPPKHRKIREFIRHSFPRISYSASIGLQFKLTERLKAAGMVNFRSTQPTQVRNINVGFGVQYDLRHKE